MPDDLKKEKYNVIVVDDSAVKKFHAENACGRP
jgi:hypothetical protein